MMNSGMLWFDNNPKTDLAAKVECAAKYYRRKYGQEPNLCLVNPSMVEALQMDASTSLSTNLGGVVVRVYQPVLPGHLWIGIEDKN